MQVIFYNFKKVENSTKRPSGGDSFECTLKDNCTMLEPTILLGLGIDVAPATSTYAYIPDFKRYYFVENWEWDYGLWRALLKVDALASYRGDIASSTQYIWRCSAKNEDSVMDNMFPTEAGYTTYINPLQLFYTKSKAPFKWAQNYGDGSYVVGIINSDNTSRVGAVSYYYFLPDMFEEFVNFMLSDVSWTGVDIAEISNELLKTLFDPFQFVVSCMWFPFRLYAVDETQDLINSIKFGFWAADAQAYAVHDTDLTLDISASYALTRHPQGESTVSYLYLHPYTQYTLMANAWGEIPLDTMLFMQQTGFDIYYKVDLVSGIGTLNIGYGPDEFGNQTYSFSSYRALVGVPIQLSQVTRDYFGGFVDIVGALAHAVTGDILGAAYGVGSTTEAMIPKAKTSGANGTIAEWAEPPHIVTQFINQVPVNNATHGRPLCRREKISDIPGFIMCDNPKVETSATKSEKDIITRYMSEGFYYE